jgi:hypothetical protein
VSLVLVESAPGEVDENEQSRRTLRVCLVSQSREPAHRPELFCVQRQFHLALPEVGMKV